MDILNGQAANANIFQYKVPPSFRIIFRKAGNFATEMRPYQNFEATGYRAIDLLNDIDAQRQFERIDFFRYKKENVSF